MTGPDRLLLWMSARQQGSWQQFRSCVEELGLADLDGASAEDDVRREHGLSTYQKLRLTLERLGHAEFFGAAGGAEWRVTPPTLAQHCSEPGVIGVLVGARTTSLVSQLVDASKLFGVSVEQVDGDLQPRQIVLRAVDPKPLVNICRALSLRLQPDAPTSLLLAVPSLRDSLGPASAIPFGAKWTVEVFSALELKWLDCQASDATAAKYGLFRFLLGYQREVLLCDRGRGFHVALQTGKYCILRRERRRVVRYSAREESLQVPLICRLPLLIERALTLCSGESPSVGRDVRGSYLSYSNVPAEIAQLAARLVGQEVMWKVQS